MVNILELILIVGGLSGWILLIYSFAQIMCNRKKELDVINELKTEIKIVTEEIQKIK